MTHKCFHNSWVCVKLLQSPLHFEGDSDSPPLTGILHFSAKPKMMCFFEDKEWELHYSIVYQGRSLFPHLGFHCMFALIQLLYSKSSEETTNYEPVKFVFLDLLTEVSWSHAVGSILLKERGWKCKICREKVQNGKCLNAKWGFRIQGVIETFWRQ